MRKCVLCGVEIEEIGMIKIGNDKYICSGDFCDDILGCLEGNEASEIARRMLSKILERCSMEALIEKVPNSINTLWDDELLISDFDRDDFCSKLRDDLYPPAEIVDFIGGDYATDDFNAVMDYLIVMTIIAADCGVYWEDICGDYCEKYEWTY